VIARDGAIHRAMAAPRCETEHWQGVRASWLGARLSRARQEGGLSVRGLSAKSGVSSSTLGYVEQGRQYPSVETLERIARALGVSAGWFMGSEPQRNQSKGSIIFSIIRSTLASMENALVVKNNTSTPVSPLAETPLTREAITQDIEKIEQTIADLRTLATKNSTINIEEILTGLQRLKSEAEKMIPIIENREQIQQMVLMPVQEGIDKKFRASNRLNNVFGIVGVISLTMTIFGTYITMKGAPPSINIFNQPQPTTPTPQLPDKAGSIPRKANIKNLTIISPQLSAFINEKVNNQSLDTLDLDTALSLIVAKISRMNTQGEFTHLFFDELTPILGNDAVKNIHQARLITTLAIQIAIKKKLLKKEDLSLVDIAPKIFEMIDSSSLSPQDKNLYNYLKYSFTPLADIEIRLGILRQILLTEDSFNHIQTFFAVTPDAIKKELQSLETQGLLISSKLTIFDCSNPNLAGHPGKGGELFIQHIGKLGVLFDNKLVTIMREPLDDDRCHMIETDQCLYVSDKGRNVCKLLNLFLSKSPGYSLTPHHLDESHLPQYKANLENSKEISKIRRPILTALFGQRALLAKQDKTPNPNERLDDFVVRLGGKWNRHVDSKKLRSVR